MRKRKKDKPEAGKAINYRIFPNVEQRKILKNWFGASRWIYNSCLHYLNTDLKPTWNINKLRKMFVHDSNYEKENIWMLKIPYDIRDDALNDLLNNHRSNQAKGMPYTIKYRTKKKNNSIAVLAKHWIHKRGSYSKVFGSHMKAEIKLPNKLDYTSRMIKTPLNKYFLTIPKPLEKRSENQTPLQTRVISLDPGVRTFLTGYDTHGNIHEIGKNDIGRLARLLHYKNKLQTRQIKTNDRKKRYRMKKAWLRLSKKIQNLVDDCHKKVSKWLCENFNYILIPKLVFHGFKKVSKKVKNKMIVWKHASFVNRLIDKQREYPWCNVEEVGESYTSKTCTNCGKLKNDLYASKIFNCGYCHIEIDRDINGARNILLRYLTRARKSVVS